jgi:pyridoxamine 5'-phosphate oxidase
MTEDHYRDDYQHHPLRQLERWLADAHDAGVPEPNAVAFLTADTSARPTARTVLLKRIEPDALLFTSTLYSRKARDIQANPHVALLWHWPLLGRQIHVTGQAEVADRALALELFSERDLSHRLQTLLSHQGQPIDDIDDLRSRHAHLMDVMEAPPECPEDWGALRVLPHTVELWLQAPDRMHDRILYVRHGEAWQRSRLAP